MRFVYISLLLLLKLGMFAQNNKFGIKAGYNLSNQIHQSQLDFRPHSSFHIGFMYSISLSEKFTFQPELLFSQKGTIFFDDPIRLNFIESPLLVGYTFKKFIFLLGPQYSHLFKVSREDFTSRVSLPNIGATAGIAYNITESLALGVRVQQDLLFSSTNLGPFNISASESASHGVEDPSTPSGFNSTKTRAFQTTLHWLF